MLKPTKRILIVEDDDSLMQRITEKLSQEGFDVSQAKNGEQGLETALKKHPDLILLDIIMPKMDGLTMLKKLRTDGWGKDVPVIMLTVLDDDKEIFAALEKGVYDFLVKGDWSAEDVVKRVKEKLEIAE